MRKVCLHKPSFAEKQDSNFLCFRMLESCGDSININCIDPLGRTALLMAIDNENLEMIELLLEFKVETKDALLHAIHEEYVEAVEVLLDHEESIHKEGDLWVNVNNTYHEITYLKTGVMYLSL